MKKESIRKQIDAAKLQINNALKADEVSSETLSAIKSLILVLDILITLFLEKQTRKNSSNSGLAPSRNNGINGNRNKDQEHGNKKGRQLENVREVEGQESITPKKCDCGYNLKNVKVKDSEERKKIDIIYEVQTHTVISEIKKCPQCKKLNKGRFPKGMEGKVQYGNGIKSMIVNFLMIQMISLERVQEYFKGILNRFISQSVMLKYVAQLGESLGSWESKKLEELLLCPVIHCDETSIRINKKNYWIHSYSYGEITLKFIHAKRGGDAIEGINIIPRYSGIIIHDCWASYLSYDNVEHALCGAHILRELKFIEDSTKNNWATEMKTLLKETLKIINRRKKQNVLRTKEYKDLEKKYKKILKDGLNELPSFPKPKGKRGRLKHTDSQNLWLRLEKYKNSVLMFARNKDVDFTNNRAERDLRDSKLKQKVSGCFRTVKNAEHFCRISSYVKSMRYQGYSSFEAISIAIQNESSF